MMENSTNGSLALRDKQYRVITIAASQQPENIKLRVAAYARVSSSSDDQMNSFAAQNSYYTTLISSNENWRMVDIYADAGLSGVSAEKREEFQRLLADCRRGLIDRVLVKSISRFARNAKDCLETVRELKSIGVSVFFEEQNIDTGKMTGELLTTVFAAIAQKESESISANMRWSYQHRMESGTYLPSSQPYGYRIKNKQIVIEPFECEIVREIFKRYLSGCSTVEIADDLNKRKQNEPRLQSRQWSQVTVFRILENERYIGDSLWQKFYTTDSLPFKKHRNYGEYQQYYAEHTHPPIIDRDTFQRVQYLLAERKKQKQQVLLPDQDPFQWKIVCESCGGHLRRKSVRGIVYRNCKTHDTGKNNCTLCPVREDELQKAFLRMYFKLKHHSETIISPMLSSLQTIRNRRMLWSGDIIELNKIISELTSQNQRLAELKKLGGVDPDIFIYKSNQLAEQLRAAKLKKERILSSERDGTIPRTRELLENLDTGPDRLDRFDAELFGELVDKVIVESSERIRFRLKNGLELAEKIERTIR